jgi:hypothetical protein
VALASAGATFIAVACCAISVRKTYAYGCKCPDAYLSIVTPPWRIEVTPENTNFSFSIATSFVVPLLKEPMTLAFSARAQGLQV